jgi:hypothetical protein
MFVGLVLTVNLVVGLNPEWWWSLAYAIGIFSSGFEACRLSIRKNQQREAEGRPATEGFLRTWWQNAVGTREG